MRKHERNPYRLILIAVVVTLVGAACGASDDDSVSEFEFTYATDAPNRTAPPEVTTETYAKAPEVAQTDQALRFSNDESAASTITHGASTVAPTADYEYAIEDAPTEVSALSYGTNPFVRTDQDNLSTFALDVDTGSYTIARNWVEVGEVPLPELIRVEEFVNFFDQDYPAPTGSTFAVYADGAPTPFTTSSRNHIVRIGIKAREVQEASRPDAVLTFVVDVSGSMNEGDRIGMVRYALTTLVGELRSTDTVAIVAYDRNAWVVLKPTQAWNQNTIISAIDRLEPGGRTNAEAGLVLGYDLGGGILRRGQHQPGDPGVGWSCQRWFHRRRWNPLADPRAGADRYQPDRDRCRTRELQRRAPRAAGRSR